MRMRHVLLSVFVFLQVFSVNAVNFSRVNVAWQYDVNFSVNMAHRVVRSNEGNVIFLRISSDSLSRWSFEFLVQDGYESESHRVVEPMAIDTMINASAQVLLRLSLPSMNENMFVVKFSVPDKSYHYDVPLKIGSLSFPSIYPVDDAGLPIVDKYINRSGFSWVGNDTFLAMQYPESFLFADPPMAEMKPMAPQVDLDTTFVFGRDPEFEVDKFYTVLKDSMTSVGVTMLRVPAYFPKYRQLGELITSMLYLTSEQERKSILKSGNPKESFDSFWMNTYTTKVRARGAIRRYYNLIEQSNVLFTDFKPGWKTDRGMMFIVYGAPDEVYRTANTEEWYYDSGLAFEFTIISTFFAPKTYTLRRSKDFEEQWYTQIAIFRRG